MPAVALVAGAPWAERPDATLVFLTSSCTTCRAWWDALAAEPGDAGVVVVTPDPSLESRRAVAALAAPLAVPVVMSTPTWAAHGVRGAPWCVVLRGGAPVRAGTGPAWPLPPSALLPLAP